MRVGLIIDHPHRDLKGYLNLSNQLLKSIDEVILIPMYHIYEIFLLDIDFYVLHNLRPPNVRIAKYLRQLNKKIFVIDNEGVPWGWSKGKEYFRNTLITTLKNNLYLVDKYFVWGSFVKDFFLGDKKKINKIRNIVVTGNQRLDLFAKKFNFLNKPRKTKKKVIIINTSSPGSNPAYSNKAGTIEALKQGFKYSNYSDKKKNLKANIDLKNSALIEYNFFKMIKKIILDFPNYKIIINIHPFENNQKYKLSFGGYKNVLILNKKFHTPRLYNNYDFLIQYNSTTCVEHFLQGKKALSVNFVDKNDILNEFYKKITLQFTSYKKIKSFIEKYDSKKIKKINIKDREYIDYLTFNSDGKSHKRISKNIVNYIGKVKLLKNTNSLKIKILLKYFFYLDTRFLVNILFYKSFIKLLLIALINSKNFYLLKNIFFHNYKEKLINKKNINIFLRSINRKKIFVSHKKSEILNSVFGTLSSISLKK